jgi:hypothetical protein
MLYFYFCAFLLACVVVPRCIHCGGMARCNISHFPDDPEDVDKSIKNDQRENFKQWLKTLHNETIDCKKNVKHRKKKKKGIQCTLSFEDPQEKKEREGEREEEKGEESGRKVLVLEIGSGDSHHGLRAESTLLLSSHPQVGFGRQAAFVRINPEEGSVPLFSKNERQQEEQLKNTAVIKLGALEAFQRLLPLVLEEKNELDVAVL